eukprot:3826510-Amphidinium_carterae.1
MEEVVISTFRVPWVQPTEMEITGTGSETTTIPGAVVHYASGEAQVNSNVVKDAEQEVGMRACPTHGMDHGIADPDSRVCCVQTGIGPLYKHLPSKRLLPVITFDYSGPHPSSVTSDEYMLVVVWAYDKLRLVWAFPVESPDGKTTVACLQVVMEELRTLTGG